MHYAVYRKLQGAMFVRSAATCAAVVDATSYDDALRIYKNMNGLPSGFIQMGKRGEYTADGWYVSIRAASKYEVDNFRVVRGPGSFDNLDVAPHNLPIVYCGLPLLIVMWSKDMDLEWVSKPEMLFGGYYRNSDGDCYYLSSM